MYNFQQGSHGPERDAERETVAYQKLLAKYEALRTAADEGVFQVTIHSDSGTITMPVSFLEGRNIAITLAEHFADWVEHVEKSLNYSLEAVGDELKLDRKEKEARQQQRNREAVVSRAADAQRELAEAAPEVAARQEGGAAL